MDSRKHDMRARKNEAKQIANLKKVSKEENMIKEIVKMRYACIYVFSLKVMSSYVLMSMRDGSKNMVKNREDLFH